MRILYLGLPLGAAVLLGSGHPPAFCAVGHPDAIGMRRLRARLPRETPLLGRPSLDDAVVRELIASARCDVLLSWFWPRRIPRAVLGSVARGAFGVHPSLLPRWRGPDPYFHAIARGDRTTGVTLHRLDERYDTGPIVERRELAIRDGDTAWTLARRLDRPSLALLVSCAERLAAGEALEGVAQDEQLATAAPRPSEEDLVLRFADEPADALERLVRAASPEPGASAVLTAGGAHDTLVTVHRARAWRGRFPGALLPGEAFVGEGGEVVVRCAEGGLALERVRVEEDDRALVGAGIATLLRADAVDPDQERG